MTHATGIGSWPGTAVRDTIGQVRELLADGLPHLPELPGARARRRHDRPHRGAARRAARRPPADGLALRRPARQGRPPHRRRCCARTSTSSPRPTTATRARSSSRSSGRGRSRRASGSRGGSGPSSTRAPAATSSSRSPTGCAPHVAAVRRLVPGAELVVQVDEPSLPTVLLGRLPTASGWGRLPSLDPHVVATGLAAVLRAHDGETIVHCCAENPPLPLLRAAAPRRALARHDAAHPPRLGGRRDRAGGRHPPRRGGGPDRRVRHPGRRTSPTASSRAGPASVCR